MGSKFIAPEIPAQRRQDPRRNAEASVFDALELNGSLDPDPLGHRVEVSRGKDRHGQIRGPHHAGCLRSVSHGRGHACSRGLWQDLRAAREAPPEMIQLPPEPGNSLDGIVRGPAACRASQSNVKSLFDKVQSCWVDYAGSSPMVLAISVQNWLIKF